MQFLKILFWCLLAFVAALFTYGNWTSVTISLWSETEALVKLPFLMLVSFLIGFVPMYVYHQVIRWRLKQRIASAERNMMEARALPIAPPPAAEPEVAAAPVAEAEPTPVAPPGDRLI
jgi:lipopolysaccharide assembly protein A